MIDNELSKLDQLRCQGGGHRLLNVYAGYGHSIGYKNKHEASEVIAAGLRRELQSPEQGSIELIFAKINTLQ